MDIGRRAGIFGFVATTPALTALALPAAFFPEAAPAAFALLGPGEDLLTAASAGTIAAQTPTSARQAELAILTKMANREAHVDILKATNRSFTGKWAPSLARWVDNIAFRPFGFKGYKYAAPTAKLTGITVDEQHDLPSPSGSPLPSIIGGDPSSALTLQPPAEIYPGTSHRPTRGMSSPTIHVEDPQGGVSPLEAPDQRDWRSSSWQSPGNPSITGPQYPAPTAGASSLSAAHRRPNLLLSIPTGAGSSKASGQPPSPTDKTQGR